MSKNLTKDDYFLSYQEAKNALIAERNYMKSIASNFGVTPAERAGAVAAAAGITSKMLILDAQFNDYLQKSSGPGVQPPSQTVLQHSAELSKELAQDLHKATQGTAVLQIINKFFTQWNALDLSGGG